MAHYDQRYTCAQCRESFVEGESHYCETKLDGKVTIDYSLDASESGADALARIGKLAAEQGLIELEIEDLEEKLKEAKKRLEHFSQKLLPEAMDQAGLDQIRTRGGLNVVVEDVVRASLPQDSAKRVRAFEYLRQTGDDGLIKREFVIAFGRDSRTSADAFSEMLRNWAELNKTTSYEISDEQTIHNQSLVAFVRRQLRDGAEIPLDAFGAFVQRTAKLKRK